MLSPDAGSGGTGGNDARVAPAPAPAVPAVPPTPTDDPLHAVFLAHAHTDAGGVGGGGGAAPFGPTLDAARFARLTADSAVALDRAAADGLFARAALAQGEAEPRLKGTRRVGYKIFRDVLLKELAREVRPRCTAAELRARIVRAAAAPVPIPVAGHLRRAQTMPASSFPTRRTTKQQRAAAAAAAQQQQQQQQQQPQLHVGQPKEQPRPRAVSFRKRAEMEFRFVDERDTVDGVVEGRAEGEGFRVVRGLDVTLGRILTDELEGDGDEAPVEGTIGGERRPDVWTVCVIVALSTFVSSCSPPPPLFWSHRPSFPFFYTQVSREEYRRLWRRSRAANGLSTKSKFALPCADLRLAMPDGEESEEDCGVEDSEEQQREDWGCASASRSRGGGAEAGEGKGGEEEEGGGEGVVDEKEEEEEGDGETAPLYVDYDDGL